MKSNTDIEQSKKLAEILPLESADMYYQYVLPKSGKIKHNPEIGNPINALEWYNKGYTTSGKEPITLDDYCVPCWSLAALLEALPCYSTLGMSDDKKFRAYCNKMFSDWYDNPVDACVAMIERLHKNDLL